MFFDERKFFFLSSGHSMKNWSEEGNFYDGKEKFWSPVESWIWQFRCLAAWKHIFLFPFNPRSKVPPNYTFCALFPFLPRFVFFQHITPITHPICISHSQSSTSSRPHTTRPPTATVFLIEKLSSSAPSLFRSHFSKWIFLKFILSLASMFSAVVIQFPSSRCCREARGQLRGVGVGMFYFFHPLLNSSPFCLRWRPFRVGNMKKEHFLSRFFLLFLSELFLCTGKKNRARRKEKRCWRNWPDFALIGGGLVEFEIHLLRWTPFLPPSARQGGLEMGEFFHDFPFCFSLFTFESFQSRKNEEEERSTLFFIELVSSILR